MELTFKSSIDLKYQNPDIEELSGVSRPKMSALGSRRDGVFCVSFRLEDSPRALFEVLWAKIGCAAG
jgi:hypothetical protein